MQKLAVILLSLSLAACGSPETDENQRASKKKATLHIPVLGEFVGKTRSGKRKKVVKLVHKAHPQVPEFVDITTDAEPFNQVAIQVEQLNESLPDDKDIELVQFGIINDFHISKTTRICYTGNAHAAVQLLLQLPDSVLSDQHVLQAYRVGLGKFDSEGGKLDPDFETDLDVPDVWTEWKGLGGAILTLASVSDGGEESIDGIVTLCK